jgi:hypothetical protein
VIDLDRIADRVAAGPGFDVSPGAISPRPDRELDDLLGELRAADVPALRDRLEAESDPFMALIWSRALRTIGSPEADAALDDYAARIAREDPWAGAFPGAGELLRYLGR